MTQIPAPLRLATHSGKFHCDDVFAYAVLRLALGAHTLLRSRNPEALASADVVWDVGSRFDEAAGRFDHHQIGAPVRPDGTPFSSAGLIWRVYGVRAVAALIGDTFAAPVAADLDASLVRRIDEVDNGVSATGPVRDDAFSLASLVGDFNPPWDHPSNTDPNGGDAAFVQAADFAEGVLRRRAEAMRASRAAESAVLAAHAAASDPRILVLDQGMPWKNWVFTHGLPVVFTISPASNGNWMLDTMPPEPGSFAQRMPLPQAWAGLQDADLAAASGVADAVFVHVRRFVGAARSRDGALAMARLALGD